jgi:hypothetical protein
VELSSSYESDEKEVELNNSDMDINWSKVTDG